MHMINYGAILIFIMGNKLVLVGKAWILVLLLTSGQAWAEDSRQQKWALSTYSGIFTSKSYGQTLWEWPGDTEKKYLHALSLTRHLGDWGEHLSFELEGILAQHHGRHKKGRQSYQEYVGVLSLRYHSFPWDNYLNTSFAFGKGFSFASQKPEREVQKDGESQRWLNYLNTELAVQWPWNSNWELLYRIHHRSGFFKVFSDGGSNFYCLGLRYRF